METRHEATVTGDWNEKSYPALVDEVRWNGWAVPWFDKATAELVVADQAAMREQYGEDVGTLEWDGDVIVLTEYAGESERIAPDPTGRYCIGGWNWCWFETDPNAAVLTEPAAETA